MVAQEDLSKPEPLPPVMSSHLFCWLLKAWVEKTAGVCQSLHDTLLLSVLHRLLAACSLLLSELRKLLSWETRAGQTDHGIGGHKVIWSRFSCHECSSARAENYLYASRLFCPLLLTTQCRYLWVGTVFLARWSLTRIWYGLRQLLVQSFNEKTISTICQYLK